MIANIVESNPRGIGVRDDENVIRANRLFNNEIGIRVFEGAESNAITGNRAESNY